MISYLKNLLVNFLLFPVRCQSQDQQQQFIQQLFNQGFTEVSSGSSIFSSSSDGFNFIALTKMEMPLFTYRRARKISDIDLIFMYSMFH